MIMARNINVDIFTNSMASSVPDNNGNVSENANAAATERESATEPDNVSPTREKPQNVIDIKNITQIFNAGNPDEYRLFDNFSISVEDIPETGQLVSIMGASGCGKSRLVRAICGLDTVQSGDILIYGKPLEEYGHSIPMVFQTYSNYEWMTVLDNVSLPMRIRGIGKKEAEGKAMELLSIVGLSDHAGKYPNRLSGGQQQRVSIARSLACNSQIMVFDEATGALDIKMKREVQNVILKIFYDSPVDPTILNITHSIEEAAYISNKVVILRPNPCEVYKEIRIRYDGEDERKRGEWVFGTRQYSDYVSEITQAMDAVCG